MFIYNRGQFGLKFEEKVKPKPLYTIPKTEK